MPSLKAIAPHAQSSEMNDLLHSGSEEKRTALCRTGFLAKGMTALLMALNAGASIAQNYPFKPIRIVASAPGGGNDLASRLLAQGLTERLGQQVVIDGRSAGVIPGEIVARANPDGYTLLYFGGSVWLIPLMVSKPPYDPLKDFSWISLAIMSPNVLVVHPSVAARSAKELIALAKTKPGELNYSSASTGTSNHLAAELFKSMTGVNLVRIPYKGAGPALNAVLVGEAQVMFPSAGAAIPLDKAGKIRMLAVTTIKPSALMPRLPTVASAGFPNFESAALTGLFAPARTPAPVIKRLNQETVRLLTQPDVKEKLFNTGVEVVASTPEQFEATVRSEMTRMGKVIRETGMRAE